MAMPRFEIISEEEAPQVPPRRSVEPTGDPALGAIMLALKTLSQRTIVALSRLAAMAMVGSVFWLFMSIPSPSQAQIIWGGMYSVFILAVLFLLGRGQ